MAISKIKTASITDDAITSEKIASGVVSASDVADGTLTGAKLATPLDLSSTVITAPKIASGGFIADANGNEQIKFTTTASAVNEITVINSATGSAPEIQSTGGDTNIDLKITPKGSGKLVLDGISFPNADGSASQVLQTNGSGVLSFATPSAGAYELLATGTATGSASSISLDGYFSSTYIRYYVFGYGVYASTTGVQIKMNMNVSGSSNTGNSYVQTNSYQYTDVNSSHGIAVQASGNGGSIDMNSEGTTWCANGDGMSDAEVDAGTLTMEIYNPANTTTWKMAKWSHVYVRQDQATWQEFFGIGVFKNTATATGVTISTSSGNLYGTFKLYGVKA